MARIIEQSIEIPERLDYSLGNGVYRLEFTRGVFGGPPLVNRFREGDILQDGEIKVQVLRVWSVSDRKIYIDVIVLTAALPVFGLVALLLSSAVLVAMFGWSLSNVAKILDTTGAEICYDKDGNEIPCPKTGLAGIIRSLSGLVFLGLIAYGVYKWQVKH